MKKTLRTRIFIVLFLGLLGMFPKTLASETIGKIVAIVNDEIITQEDLWEMLKELPEAGDAQNFLVRQNVLEHLIENRLILQEAKETEVSVTDEELEEVIRQIRNRYPSQEVFEEALSGSGYTYKTFVERHREQLIIRKMMAREIRNKCQVSPNEIRKYYKEHMGQFQSPPSWKLSHILIQKSTPGEPDPTALERAKKLRKRLLKGESFTELAKQYSEGPRKDSGGELGYVEREKLLKEIESALADLPEGGISKILETPGGYNLFRMEGAKETEARPYKDVRNEIYDIYFNQKVRKQYKAWMDELKSRAYIQRADAF
ncbi:MAG: peptidylprolyl isomerase [Candidatus Omnitrophota bacterium]